MANTLLCSRQNCRVLAHWLSERAQEERDTREWIGGRESKKIPAEFSNIIFIDYLMQKLFHRRVLLQFAKIEAEIFANYIKQKFLNPTSSPSSNFSHPLTATRPSCFFFRGGEGGDCLLHYSLLISRSSNYVISQLFCSARFGYYTTDWDCVLLKATSKSLISISADISGPGHLCLAALFRFRLSVTWNRMRLTFYFF